MSVFLRVCAQEIRNFTHNSSPLPQNPRISWKPNEIVREIPEFHAQICKLSARLSICTYKSATRLVFLRMWWTTYRFVRKIRHFCGQFTNSCKKSGNFVDNLATLAQNSSTLSKKWRIVGTICRIAREISQLSTKNVIPPHSLRTTVHCCEKFANDSRLFKLDVVGSIRVSRCRFQELSGSLLLRFSLVSKSKGHLINVGPYCLRSSRVSDTHSAESFGQAVAPNAQLIPSRRGVRT